MRKPLLLQLIVLVVWVGLGGLLGYLRGKVSGRNYVSRATVLYEISTSQAGSGSTRSLQALLQSDQVIQQALRNGQLGAIFEYADDPNLLETLRARIRVEPMAAGPGAFVIEYLARTQEAAAPTLEALLGAAQKTLGEARADFAEEYLAQLQRMHDLFEQRWRALRTIDPVSLPDAPEGSNRVQYWQDQCDQLRREIAWLQQQLRRASGPTEVDQAVPGALAEVPAGSLPTEAPAIETLPPELAARDQQLELRRQLLEPLLERQAQLAKNFGPDHAELKEVRRRIEIVTDLLSRSPPPPLNAVSLMVDEQILLDQFGPAHPKVQEVRRKIKEILAATVSATSTTSPEPVRSTQPVNRPATIGRPASEPSVRQPAKTESLQDRLQAAEQQLAYLEHALSIAHYETALAHVQQQLDSLRAEHQAGAERLRILSAPSPAQWAWRNDLWSISIGGLVGLVAGIVFQLVGRAASRFTSEAAMQR